MGRKSEFSREEKIAAVRPVTDGGRTALSVANEYGVHENTVLKWKRQYRTNPEPAFSGQNGETPPDEAERMRRRIRALENEVEFLKKCPRTLPSARSKVRADQETCGESALKPSVPDPEGAPSGILRMGGAPD